MPPSPMQVLILLAIALMLYPIARILRRTGHSGWWTLVALIPVVNWICVWVLAFVHWPAVDKPRA